MIKLVGFLEMAIVGLSVIGLAMLIIMGLMEAIG